MQNTAEIFAAVEEAEQMASDATGNGTACPRLTYEDGVYAALAWVIEDGPHPIEIIETQETH